MNDNILLSDATKDDIEKIGGKAANLAALSSAGFSVPPGFVVPVDTYEQFLENLNLKEKIVNLLETIDFTNDDSMELHSSEIKELILSNTLKNTVAKNIDKTLKQLDKTAVWAVRSSAIAEDLPGASFAGQQDSFLNIETVDVPKYVRKCWASYWNKRALSYRHDANIDHLCGGVAVIVQRMVDAKSSGVLFTKDPIDDEKDILIIESSWGLGEAIVSGIVSPDRFTISRTSKEPISSTINTKQKGIYLTDNGKKTKTIEKTKQAKPSLSKKEIELLTNQGLEIEDYFQKPQDIEWSIEGKKLYILQARPITTIEEKADTVWTRAYGDEYWADVTSPLFFSLLGEYLSEYVNREGAEVMGYKDLLDKELLRMHKGHVYFNAEYLEEFFIYSPKFSRTKELLNYFPEEKRDKIKNAKTKLFKLLLGQLRVAIIDPDGMMGQTDKAYLSWAKTFLLEMQDFDKKDLAKLSYDQLHDEFLKMEKAYLKHYRLIRYGMVTHSIVTNLMVKNWLDKWLGDKNGILYSSLISGLEGNKTIETNIALSKLAKKAKKSRKLTNLLKKKDADYFLNEINTNKQYKNFKKAFDTFLKQYGHRSHTREIYFPRWVDDPTLVVSILKSLISSSISDLEKLEKEKIKERIDAEKEIFRKISKLKGGFFRKILFKKVLSYAQTYLIFRENQRFYLDHQIMRQRRLFMEYARRLAEEKRIGSENDIFFMSKDEIFEISKTNKKADKKSIKRLKNDFERYKKILPPKYLKGKIEFDDAIKVQDHTMSINGAGASPGVATAKIRIIESINNLSKIKEGEIIVASNTDPGWTPVFSKLKGLITETGGILSHGAVVSREYGIPAVTAVKDATKIFKTGQIVTIDGNEGAIYIKQEKQDTDVIHGFGNEKEHNESFYFNFYDKKQNICGFMRIGLKPNKDEKSMFCFLMMPDDTNIGMRGLEKFKNDKLSVDPLSFVKKKSEKKWALRYGGPMVDVKDKNKAHKVSFELVFDSLNDIFNYRDCVSGHAEEISKNVASEHLEQYGRVKGKISVDGKEFEIDSLGDRDHSWGIRDWTSPKMWVWLTSQFSEKVALNVTKLIVKEGKVDAGFIHLDGKNHPLIHSVIDTKYDRKGAPKSFTLKLKDKEGKTYEVSAKVLRYVMLPFEGEGKNLSVMYETLARYTLDKKIGYGIAEYLIRKF
ncbi:MAG: PEP/pyruvate-binding domain-containing protein [Candidatus Thermoplasmatota archaeon]|nr:PEP/pyruvate-binding domain-containing protein [Candidatus Thermoplasmatota archaeon]